MILTHLVFHEFFSGASTSGESDSIGGSLSLPPYFLFDGFSEVGASNDTFGSTLTLPPYYLFNGFSDASSVVPTVEQTGRWQPLRKRKERIRIKVNADIIELYGVDEVSRVLTELRKDVPRAAKARAVEIARAATPLTDISHDVIELVEAPDGAVEDLTLMLDDIDRYYWSIVYAVMRQIEDDDEEVILLMTMH